MYSYLPRGPELPEWGGLKAADSVFTLLVALAVGPKGTYCRSYQLSLQWVDTEEFQVLE